MKIVCESCGAKYSIADEKVAGKVFKIRCKRCSEVIMVRGDQQAAAPAPDAGIAAAAGAPDEIWHIVVNGEQQGPHSPAQLGEMLTNGTVDWDAYIWTEGFDNWVPMRDVEDLVAQITGGGQQQAATAAAAQTTAAGGFHAAAAAQTAVAASDAYTAQPSMGADPFADPPIASSATEDAGPDLFGGVGAAAGGGSFGGGGVVASSPSPSNQEQAMTGTRNENSVLFSLKNLQALATGSNAPSAAPPSATAGAAGFASGEGSGLIDIRALASATGIGDSPAKSDGDSKDELLAMGGQGAAFGTLGSPMLAPASDDREGGNKMLVMASIIGVSVVMAGGLVAFAMLRQPEAPPPPPPGVAAPGVAPAPTPGPAPTPTEPAAGTAQEPEEPPSEGARAAQAAAEAEAEAEDRKRTSASGKSHSGSRKSRPKPDEPEQKAVESEPEPAPKPKPRGGKSSLDELLQGALGGGGSKRATKKPAADENLPDKPGRKDVVSAMKGVSGAVSACGKGAGGVAFANVTVSGSTGRVKSVQVEGQTGAVGSCIARAVRKARFPRFKANVFQVKYPFRL